MMMRKTKKMTKKIKAVEHRIRGETQKMNSVKDEDCIQAGIFEQ